jgi:putative nucleotidyltransferase with HDIG domain
MSLEIEFASAVAVAFALTVGILLASVKGLAMTRAARQSEVQCRGVTQRVATQLEEEPALPKIPAPRPAIPVVEKDELGPLGKLPPFGPVVVRLLHLCGQPDVGVGEVAQLVESDGVIGSELLKLVNSPLFGVRGAVSTPGHAVTMLGVDRTRAMVTSLVVRFMAESISDKNMIQRVWQHSLATAVLARQLARVFQVEENLAHTAAMLHDLGRLGLLAAYRGAYVQLATKSYETMEDIVAAEEARFGMSHCKAGSLLARAWGFPENLQAVMVRNHETPGRRDLPSLVQISCELADSFTFESIHRWDVGTPTSIIEARALPDCRDEMMAALEGIENTIIAHVQGLEF